MFNLRHWGLILGWLMLPSLLEASAERAVLPEDVMSLAELEIILRQGPVKAYFKSVPQGYALEKYDIQIEEIKDFPGLKVIIFTTRHEIVAGMSGSPVYLRGKCVGALAYSFSLFPLRQSWGGISPAELMFKENRNRQQSLSGASANSPQSFVYRGMTFKPIEVGVKKFDWRLGLGTNPFSGLAVFQQSGGSGEEKVSSFSASDLLVFHPLLKPGLPIAVDLLSWRDEEGANTFISALGTITYVDRQRGRIFAFGHPFLGERKVAYPFRTSKIIGTVYSQYDSYKLGGQPSAILGLIEFDGIYGIYGQIQPEAIRKIRHFNLDFQRQGEVYKRLDVFLARSENLDLLLMSYALELAGLFNGAPSPGVPSTTELTSDISLKDFSALKGRHLSFPESFYQGATLVHSSSYQTAVQKFVWGVYAPLLTSAYQFEISDLRLTANFLSGRLQVVQLAEVTFPSKVIWQENPVLEIKLVSQSNTTAFSSRKLVLKFNWDQIEEPTYTQKTKETEKDSEKVIGGWLMVFHPRFLREMLLENDKQEFAPAYFLGPEDFLQNFQGRLLEEEPRLWIRVNVRARGGLFEKWLAEKEERSSPDSAVAEKEGDFWLTIKGGLKERLFVYKNQGLISWGDQLPTLPAGYILHQNLKDSRYFEIVKRDQP